MRPVQDLRSIVSSMHNKMSITDIPGAVRVSTTLDTEVGHKGGVDITLLHLGGAAQTEAKVAAARTKTVENFMMMMCRKESVGS